MNTNNNANKSLKGGMQGQQQQHYNTSNSNNAFGNGLFMPEEFKQNVPVDVQRIFAPKGNQMSPPGINQNSIFNQNDFMLSGFDEDDDKQDLPQVQSCSQTLQSMALQICPYCLKLVTEPPYKVVECARLKEKKFPVHNICEEGTVRLKIEFDLVSTMYTFSQQSNEGRLAANAMAMQLGRPKLHSSHLVIAEIQHPASSAVLYSIQQISDLFQSPYSMNSDHVRLNLNGNQLYQPLQYIVPLPIFSIRATVINLEDKKNFQIDMVVNLGQFESGTELELRGRKEGVGELKICGIVLDKIESRINANKTTYQIPPQWFAPGTGTKCFQLFTIELDFIDHAIEKVRKTIQENFSKLNLNTQPYTPPLSVGSPSPPSFSPLRDISPSGGCTTPPHEQLTYSSIKGQIVTRVMKNKDWSMAVQALIKKSSDLGETSEIQAVIDEVKPKLVELMKHHYGNYFSKTLVIVSTMQQKYQILQEIKDSFAEIAQDPQGTHAIQSLVESIKSENEQEQILIIQSVFHEIIPMALNQYGTHVINKIVQNFAFNNILSIFDAAIKNFREVVKNKQGVCIIKSLMARCVDVPAYKSSLLALLKQDIRQIVADKYGNYALQEAVKIYSPEETAFISEFVYENMIQLAQNQVSSNIVEAALQYSKKNRSRFIQKIMENMSVLFSDPFGKFVLKRVLNLVDVDSFQLLQFKQLLNQHIAANPKSAAFYTNAKPQSSPKQQNMNMR